MKKFTLIITVLVLISSGIYAQHDPFQLAIDVYKADSVIKAHSNSDHFFIIDLRRPNEVATGYIEGAVNHNYYGEGFEDTLASLDKNKEYLIYCASGGRSNATFNMMKTMEFTMVYNMQGGANAWRNAGLPLVTGSTGINMISDEIDLVKLFPNPVTSESMFFNNDQYLPINIRVLNIQGQTIIQNKIEGGLSKRLEIEKLEKGLYFYQVYSEGQIIQSGKFIKN